jgi:hypothetical protein
MRLPVKPGGGLTGPVDGVIKDAPGEVVKLAGAPGASMALKSPGFSGSLVCAKAAGAKSASAIAVTAAMYILLRNSARLFIAQS